MSFQVMPSLILPQLHKIGHKSLQMEHLATSGPSISVEAMPRLAHEQNFRITWILKIFLLQMGASFLGLQWCCDSPFSPLWCNTEHSAAQSCPAERDDGTGVSVRFRKKKWGRWISTDDSEETFPLQVSTVDVNQVDTGG